VDHGTAGGGFDVHNPPSHLVNSNCEPEKGDAAEAYGAGWYKSCSGRSEEGVSLECRNPLAPLA